MMLFSLRRNFQIVADRRPTSIQVNKERVGVLSISNVFFPVGSVIIDINAVLKS